MTDPDVYDGRVDYVKGCVADFEEGKWDETLKDAMGIWSTLVRADTEKSIPKLLKSKRVDTTALADLCSAMRQLTKAVGNLRALG